MPLTKAEQEELNSLRQELGFGPLGEPLPGAVTPTYSPESTVKTAKEVAADVAPMLGSTLATMVAPAVGIPARMAVSGLGAGVGTGVKQLIETYGLDRPVEARRMLGEYAKEMLLGAAGEGAGQVIGRGLTRLGSAIRESGPATRLFGPTVSAAEDMAARQEVQRLLQRYGTTLGIQEAAPASTTFRTMERLSRVGPTKAAVAQDEQFKQAISKEVSALADEVTSTVLTREQIGAGLLEAQKQGRGFLYKDYGDKLGSIMDQGGAIPVDTSALRGIGQNAISKAQEVLQEGTSASAQLGAAGLKEAQDLLALKPNLTFQQANEVLSNLLEKQREFEKGTKAYNIVQQAVNTLKKSMDEAANKSAPELLTQYRQLQSGYAQAVKELDPKILSNAAGKFPEKIADNLVNAKSVAAWREIQTSLNRAKSLGVDTAGLAENVQRAYLEKVFADSAVTNVANKLKDKAFSEQFNAVLPQAIQNRAKVIAKAGQILSERGKSIDLATAAAVSSAGGAALGGTLQGDVSGLGLGSLGGIASLILAPKIAAKIAYSPTLTNKLLRASSDATAGNFAAAAIKLTEMYRQVREPSDIAEPVSAAPSASTLTADEQAELDRLRKEFGVEQ